VSETVFASANRVREFAATCRALEGNAQSPKKQDPHSKRVTREARASAQAGCTRDPRFMFGEDARDAKESSIVEHSSFGESCRRHMSRSEVVKSERC